MLLKALVKKGNGRSRKMWEVTSSVGSKGAGLRVDGQQEIMVDRLLGG